MEHNHLNKDAFARLFQELPSTTTPEGLYKKTIVRIRRAEARMLRLHLALSASLSIFASYALFRGIIYTYSQLETTGFIEYFSLALSDGSTFMRYWHEIGMSLLESLPIVGVILTLTSLLFVLYGLRLVVMTYSGRARYYQFA